MRLVSALYDAYHPFHEWNVFDEFATTNNPDDLKVGDALVVWGGGDISPALYNKPISSQSGASDDVSWRDRIEWALMQRAKELSVPIIGICRGAQMLCALAGGYLIQHVNGHGGYHMVRTYDDQLFMTNSLHHQMMHPFNQLTEEKVDHVLVAWAESKHSSVYYDGDELREDITVEPEMIYFPKERGFAIQWHPEMERGGTEATKYIHKFIKERL